MSEGPDGVIIDNRTGLPDDQVREAVRAHWVETAAFQFGSPSTFQIWANSPEGSLLARTPFRVPKDVIEEIVLARAVADADDDIRAVIGQEISAAYRDGFQHQHPDEQTTALFNEWAKYVSEDALLKELHHEYLIAGQFTTLALFTRTRFSFTPEDTDTQVNTQLAVPLIGVLPSEFIRVVSTDLFGNGDLAYDVTNAAMKQWLDEFFSPRTTVAKRNQMATQEPVVAAVFTGRMEIPWNDPDITIAGKVLYTLNQQMTKRTTMPKGAAPYPRPLLTSNFALLEAKRLLNIMDYSLLQGGTNYIVVAKTGSDKLPAQQPEVDNLMNEIRLASRSGVMVGDHRLEIDIITPDLKELLNPVKREMVGRKITQALMRIPSQITEQGGSEGIKAEMTLSENTITSDRRDVRRHLENHIYDQIVKRNPTKFKKGAPKIWMPRIVLADSGAFYDAVLKTRDRGDIPRKWSVEMLGFDFEAGVAQRKREKAAGLDELMQPGNVPFSSPNAGPQDNNPGRPPGSRDGAPQRPAQARPTRRIGRTPGETIRAQWDATDERTLRVGESTERAIEFYPDFQVGRLTQAERDAVAAAVIAESGPSIIVPVNTGYDVGELRALRLTSEISMLVGQRLVDDAMVARALCFRDWTRNQAEDMVQRLGFELPPELATDDSLEELAALQTDDAVAVRVAASFAEMMRNLPQPTILVQLPGQRPMRVIRDPETGAVIGTEPAPEDT
jgi:hypothetical protein